jgi:hypothetical protein
MDDSRLGRLIAEHGFSVMAVFASEKSPGFAYTVGLTESAKHPELLIFGLPPQMAHIVMHNLVARIKQGDVYRDSDLIVDVLSHLPIAAKSIATEKAADYTVQLFNYYAGRPLPPTVLQLVLPDTRGQFPWSERFEERYRSMQPALWEAIH